MKQFYLYLDESGNFESDGNFQDNPSLVGGVLAYDCEISMDLAAQICGNKEMHGCKLSKNEFSSEAMPILRELKIMGCDLVVFENKERLEVVDGDTTYLNILSEGVIQLLQYLSSKFGDIKLCIVVAVRKAVNRDAYKNGHIISGTEYIKRLEEKIIIGIARKSISSIKKGNWEIFLKTAKTDYRLMLADVVCHTWFRKDRKFTIIEQKELASMFKTNMIFSVFPSELDMNFKRLMIRGDLGEAAYDVFTDGKEKSIPIYVEDIVSALKSSNEFSKELQLKILFSKIMNLYYLDLDFKLTRSTIHKIKKYLIPELDQSQLSSVSFKMDLRLILFSIATHEGDIITADEEMTYCKELIPLLVGRWESLDYFFIYKIREGVHLLNKYDINTCIDEMDSLENIIENTFGLFPLADDFENVCSELKSDIRGKVLGNRLQARFSLISEDPIQLEYARRDSNMAITEFVKTDDIKRQYQYRCRIEYEAGNYEVALIWLFKSFDIEVKDFKLLLEQAIKAREAELSFTLMHYVNIMAVAYAEGDKKLAEKMFECWNILRVGDYLSSINKNKHPYEIIFWKIGSYLMQSGSFEAALNNYKTAEQICDRESKNYTLKAISLGIKAEMIAFVFSNCDIKCSEKKIEIFKVDLSNAYFEFMNLKLPLTMTRYFLEWKPLMIQLKEGNDQDLAERLLKFSKRVIY